MKLDREAIANLEQNRLVSTSLKNYASDMMALTYHAGVVLAAMNSYGLYDRICDTDCSLDETVADLFRELCGEIQRTLLIRCRGLEYQMGCTRLASLRERLILLAEKAQKEEELLEQYAMLMETLNPVYAAFLLVTQTGKPEKSLQPCMELMRLLTAQMQKEQPASAEELEAEALPLLVAMEGLQEHYYQPLYRYQLAFPDIYEGYEEGIHRKKELADQYELLNRTRKLLSSSPFAPL